MDSDGVPGGVRFSRQAKSIILLVGVVSLAWLLLRVPNVLGPFLWGAVIAYIFAPAVDWVEMRTRLPRVGVVLLLYLVGVAVMAWVSTAFLPLVFRQAGDLVADMPRIMNALVEQWAVVDQWLAAREIGPGGLSVDPQVLVNQVVAGAQELLSYVTRHAIPAVFSVLEGLGQFVLCVIVAFYLLKGSKNLGARLRRLIPPPYRSEAQGLLEDIDRVLAGYIRGQLLLIGVMALAIFVALSVLRLRYALVIALVSGVLEVIPLFGPIMAGGIAASVALFQPHTPFGWSNLTLALAVVVTYIVLRQIEDHLIVPILVGPLVDLHPLLVLFALVTGGKLAGLTGMVIAVPTAAALKIIAAYLYGKIWDEHAEEEVAIAPPPAVPEASTVSGETP